MRCYVYEVIVCDEKNGTEKPKGELVLSHVDDLDRDQWRDENPRVMGSNEYLRPLYDGEAVIIHGGKALVSAET